MTSSMNAASQNEKAVAEREMSWIGARLREPSTYAGMAIFLVAIFHLGSGEAKAWASAITYLGMGVGALIAIVLPEGKSLLIVKPLVILPLCAAALACAMGPSPAIAQPGGIGVADGVPYPYSTSTPASRKRYRRDVGAKSVPKATASTPLPKSAPVYDTATPTVMQAQQNPLVVLQHTVADPQAALADAQAQNPPDTTAANCYKALIPFVQSQAQNPLPSGAGVFQALQKARDAKAYLANIQSPTGPLAGLNQACAPLVLDVQNTLITLGVSVGVLANPAAGAATLAGLPAAVAAFLHLPPLP